MFKEKFNQFIEEFGWSKLRALGHNSIIKSSYIWLIIVPLAAKIFSALPETHTFRIFEANIIIHFRLPFSWVVFYFMALFFAIGQLIYSLKCPEILKNYANFSDYKKSGAGVLLILKYLEEYVIASTKNKLSSLKNELDDFLKRIPSSSDSYIKEKLMQKMRMIIEKDEHECEQNNNFSNNETVEISTFDLYKNHSYESYEKYLNEWFYIISNAYEQVNHNWLKTSIICFGLGFFFFTIIVIQNLWFVLKAIF
jgi:hypothetical protein